MLSIRIGTPRKANGGDAVTLGDLLFYVLLSGVALGLLYGAYSLMSAAEHPELATLREMRKQDAAAEVVLDQHRGEHPGSTPHIVFAVAAQRRQSGLVPAEDMLASLESIGGMEKEFDVLLVNVDTDEEYLKAVRSRYGERDNFHYEAHPQEVQYEVHASQMGHWGAVHPLDFHRTACYLNALDAVEPFCQQYYMVLEDDLRWCPHALQQYLLPALRVAESTLQHHFTALRVGPGAGGVLLRCDDIPATADMLRSQFRAGPHHLLLGVHWTRDSSAWESEGDWFSVGGRSSATLKFSLLTHLVETRRPGKRTNGETLSPRDRHHTPKCMEYQYSRKIWPDENFNLVDCAEYPLTPCPAAAHQYRVLEDDIDELRAAWYVAKKHTDPDYAQLEVSRSSLVRLLGSFALSAMGVFVLGLFCLRALQPDWWALLTYYVRKSKTRKAM
jgi:hypothetical protein